MRWGVEKRLEFIEFRLFWEGGINRADIMECFGVSVPQASKDLSLYEEKAPGNLIYSKREKRYFAAPNFNLVFLKPDADLYLAQLRSASDWEVSAEETRLAVTPEADAMPVPHRSVQASVLRALLAAIRHRKAIEILYQSMNLERPAPAWQWITPHAFGNNGLRWHLRAYCHIDRKFKDFLLARCLEARGEAEAGAQPEDDIFWNEKFPVILAPNPTLNEYQRAVVAQDYEMKDGRITVLVRKALLYYFQKRLSLDTIDTLDGSHETLVVISNRDQFAQALSEATA